ncbi:MAG: NifB/NifX family molybdenum-iron cluster-binding protein [Bacteroidota bacterium]|jgi:predicted Fe-Mo cluster-binding NifX family protein
MKAAIPTNDGLMMASSFEEARGFLVLNIELGKVIKEEMIGSNAGRSSTAGNVFDLLNDCTAVLTGNITDASKTILENRNISVIASQDSIITNVIMNYLGHEVGKVADTCCCP